jgi:hypothetical protein
MFNGHVHRISYIGVTREYQHLRQKQRPAAPRGGGLEAVDPAAQPDRHGTFFGDFRGPRRTGRAA